MSKRKQYAMDEKLSAVCTYLTSTSMVATAKSTGINRKTLVQWKTTDWWDTEQTRLQHEKAEQHRQQYSKIVDKANQETLDRLENGDFAHYQGKKFRIPVKAKEAAIISGIATEKIHLADNMSISISSNQSSTEAIKALAQQFKDLSDSYKEKQANAIPGEHKRIEKDQEK